MKKILSLAIASLTLVSALVSCAPAADRLDSAITVASSNAAEYAAWLDRRLDIIPDEVVLGVDSDESYGIDMSDFENEGYLIRRIGNEVLLFGKTADGLDRAVRKYAKAVEAGDTDAIDTVYLEGKRIKRLTIAGNDISEYTIVYDPSDPRKTVKVAAQAMSTLVEKACGVTLPIAQSAEGRTITIATTDESELRDDGYRYSVTDGNLLIEGAFKRGALNAVWRFVQHELDWRQLIYGDSYLMPSDHVDVAEGTARSETPSFDFLSISGRYGKQFVNEAPLYPEYYSYKIMRNCNHGMSVYRWCDEDFTDRQICYTSEARYAECRDNVVDFLEQQVASGAVLGVNLISVDIAQADNHGFCTCKECRKVFKKEGGHSGYVVSFANRLADELQTDYAGIMVQIFAYSGTNAPPKVTKPNDFVHITFCYDTNCSNHKVDGSECDSKVLESGYNNEIFAEWFDGWAECTDNIAVWGYTIGGHMQQYTVIDNIYSDYRYWAEKGVRAVFIQSDNKDFGIQRIEHQLIHELNWNTDMTEEEFMAHYVWLFEKEYGEGWDNIYEYVKRWNTAQDLTNCWQNWGWSLLYCWDLRYDPSYVAETFDSNMILFDNALALADSRAEERRIEQLSCHMIYQGCYSSYFNEYLEGDEERIAVLSERFDLLSERLASCGFDPARFDNGRAEHHNVTDGLYAHAWKNWTERFDVITGQPLPENIPVIE